MDEIIDKISINRCGFMIIGMLFCMSMIKNIDCKKYLFI